VRHLAIVKGPSADWPGPFHISVTRFTYRRVTTMPFVFWNGMQLRRGWGEVDGAVSLSLAAGLMERTTYTVSAWRREDDLRRWVRTPGHMRLMRDYRARLESSAADGWNADIVDLRAAWKEAFRRLAPT
jgi:hypothetical protein